MNVEQGEVQLKPPHSTEYIDRLTEVVHDRSIEVNGSLSALNDLLRDNVSSPDDVIALFDAAKRQLIEQKHEGKKRFLFSYIGEIERIMARITSTKLKGEKYDA